jgi:predicted ATP-dependent serine protease
MIETALPTTNFAENAGMTVSRVFAVLWCIAQNIYRKGEQRTMKMIENEMNVTVPLEIIKASEIEPKEVKWLWYPYIPFGKVTLLQGDSGDGKSKLMLSIVALLSNGEPRRRMLPDYGTVSMKGTQYYRNRVTDQQGRRVSLYARRL